jgi:hypothetical protein
VGNIAPQYAEKSASNGPARSLSAQGMTLAVVRLPMSATYATGGDTVVLGGGFRGRQVLAIFLETEKSGANRYTVTEAAGVFKVQAWSAFNTEVANGADLSAVSLRALVALAP